MDDGGNFTPNSSFGAFPDTAMDLDFMDELLYEGCWLEATDAFDFLQPGPSSSGAVNDPPSQNLPYSECTTDHLSINLNTNQPVCPEGTERKFFENPSPVCPKIEEFNETHPGNQQGLSTTTGSGQSGSFLVEESGKRLWIAPRANSGPSSSVKERLKQAICHMKDYVKDGNVLVQIWVPVKRGDKQVLTTDDQPYSHDPESKSLLSYRNVSKTYHFAADEDSKELAGLPGRVFLGRLPEWTPDVHFFRSDEYPQVDFAQQFDVHGSIALPVFERSSGACLGVVEVITTSQMANYRPDLENVCKALEAVDLRSENISNLCAKPINETHQAALLVIAEVLRSICKTHSLPLALTWVPGFQEDVGGCQQSDGINALCFLTAESAYIVTDQSLLGFVDACSEHQLFQGQGIVGKAVTSGKQCFAADITAFSRSVYPLSHHARMFGLRGAVAIPLRGVNTGQAEFVLELFLPNRCQDTEERRRMLNSLSIVIQQCCQRLHLVMDKELEEIILPFREGHTSNASLPSKEASPEQSSWIVQIMESQRKGKGVSVSWDYQKEEPKEEFKVTTHWDDAQMESNHKQVFPEFGQFQQISRSKSSVEGDGDSSSLSVRRLVGSRKSGEKRRTKAEKAIGLQVLRQSEKISNLFTKPINETHHAALLVIAKVLRSICKTHSLPLAQTWVPSCQEDVGGCLPLAYREHSDGINALCFLTAESAYFVTDQSLLDFVDACSEHQLFQGQGIVGKAVASGKQCFAADITAFSKSVYPLSNHARMFGLHGAVAIPLRGVNTGWAEFVLELFLPNRCQDTEERRQMLNSLSIVIQQCCQRLHLVMDKELEEIILPVREGHTSNASSPSKEASPEQSSWIAQIMESQQKGKGVSVSWDYQKEEPKEEFKVTTHWDDAQMESYHKQVFPELGQFQQNSRPKSSVEGDGGSSSLSVRHLAGSRKPGEKRRTKAEKTISLQVLRQYFAGSLKDAAKSIGVCPTTLKRICRQHGITRWPSRKIKKVGHSLRKLQLVIDSVQGGEGAIQIGSFYTSFPELSSPNVSGSAPFSSMKTGDHSKPLNPQQPDNNGLISIGATASKSLSSSCSQSSGSSTCCSTGAMQNTATINALSSGDALMVENSGGMLKRTLSDAGLHALNQEEPKLLARSQSHKTLGEHPSLECLPPLPKHRLSGTFRVKATFGEEKIRFSLQPNWGFLDVQQEIAKRFNIDDVSRFGLKYLDDDHEWVLLTCDADLEECIDIYKSSQSRTIKISIHSASKQKFGKLVHSNALS